MCWEDSGSCEGKRSTSLDFRCFDFSLKFRSIKSLDINGLHPTISSICLPTVALNFLESADSHAYSNQDVLQYLKNFLQGCLRTSRRFV